MPADGVAEEFSDQRYRYAKSKRYGAIIVTVAFLVGTMSGATTTGVVKVYMGIGAVIIAFLAIGLVRSFQVGIWLTPQGVEVRTTYATKRWAWNELVRARTQDHEMRTNPYVLGVSRRSHREPPTKIYPIVDLASGREVRLYGMQLVSKGFGIDSWIDEAVLTINRRLEARRGGPDPIRG